MHHAPAPVLEHCHAAAEPPMPQPAITTRGAEGAGRGGGGGLESRALDGACSEEESGRAATMDCSSRDSLKTLTGSRPAPRHAAHDSHCTAFTPLDNSTSGEELTNVETAATGAGLGLGLGDASEALNKVAGSGDGLGLGLGLRSLPTVLVSLRFRRRLPDELPPTAR
jgi:hypothetical protein